LLTMILSPSPLAEGTSSSSRISLDT